MRTPHLLDVIIYMLEMNNQQRKNCIRQKGVMSKKIALAAGLIHSILFERVCRLIPVGQFLPRRLLASNMALDKPSGTRVVDPVSV